MVRDKELEALKANLEEVEQKFYDEGFNNAECFGRKVIFDTQLKRFLEGWMATVNSLDLSSFSSFRDSSQVPLLKDSVEALVEETHVTEGDILAMW